MGTVKGLGGYEERRTTKDFSTLLIHLIARPDSHIRGKHHHETMLCKHDVSHYSSWWKQI